MKRRPIFCILFCQPLDNYCFLYKNPRKVFGFIGTFALWIDNCHFWSDGSITQRGKGIKRWASR